VERARAAFEALLERQQFSTNPNAFINHSQQQQIPAAKEKPEHELLTNSSRRLRELEIELLKSLTTSDAAIDELIHLWTTERDEEASIYLLTMQSACSAGLVQEEEALRRMSERYPAWAEPYARLATLLFYKGRAEEAVAMAEKAVDLKPWHFEALQIAQLLSQTDFPLQHRAQRLARKAIPKLSDPYPARKMWVDRAVAQALQQYREAEQSTREQHTQQKDRQCIFREEDIWQ